MRNKKKGVLIPEYSPNMLTDLISIGGEKLGIKAISTVLEEDGTDIDEDGMLTYNMDKTFILLEENEQWQPVVGATTTEPIVPHDNANMDTSTAPNVQQNLPLGVDAHLLSESNDASMVEQVELRVSPAIADALTSRRFEAWESFEIPWETFDPDVLLGLEQGSDSYKVRTKSVHRIVAEMTFLQPKIKAPVFKTIAQKMVNAYPRSFQDKKTDGTKHGKGYASIYKKLLDHYTNQNRPHKKTSIQRALNIPTALNRTVAYLKSGCIDWQPDELPKGETETTLEKKKIYMKNYEKLDLSNADVQKTLDTAFEKTYVKQRFYLNNIDKIPTAQEVHNEWPTLFLKNCLLSHFTRLTGVKLADIQRLLTEDINRIIYFGTWKQLSTIDKTASIESRTVEAFWIIFKYFGENPETLFRTCEVSFILVCSYY